MKKSIVHLLGDSYTMPLQVHDDDKITHGLRHHEVVVQVEQQKDHIRFLLENQHSKERNWFSASLEEWQRFLHAPNWQHVSWFPFVTYERMTSLGKATLTRREDPLSRKRRDLLSSEFWQARLYLTEGILTTFTEFSCLAGQAEAFCDASEWTVLAEQGTYTPAYTVNALAKEQPKSFRVTEGLTTIQNIGRVYSEREFSRVIAQYKQLYGHNTILARDLQILKLLLPNTKVAREHSPTGLPLQ
jgi:hypothetical protein